MFEIESRNHFLQLKNLCIQNIMIECTLVFCSYYGILYVTNAYNIVKNNGKNMNSPMPKKKAYSMTHVAKWNE